MSALASHKRTDQSGACNRLTKWKEARPGNRRGARHCCCVAGDIILPYFQHPSLHY